MSPLLGSTAIIPYMAAERLGMPFFFRLPNFEVMRLTARGDKIFDALRTNRTVTFEVNL